MKEEPIPLACLLPGPELAARLESLRSGFAREIEEVRELEDGYAFRVPGSEAQAARVLELVAFERRCCPFFRFEMIFEAAGGPLWLQIRGPEGAKELLRQLPLAGPPSGAARASAT